MRKGRRGQPRLSVRRTISLISDEALTELILDHTERGCACTTDPYGQVAKRMAGEFSPRANAVAALTDRVRHCLLLLQGTGQLRLTRRGKLIHHVEVSTTGSEVKPMTDLVTFSDARPGSPVASVSETVPMVGGEAPAEAVEVLWQPKLAAYRDLFLLFLLEQDGTVTDPRGRIATAFRERFGLPQNSNTKTFGSEALRLMDQAGLVSRQHTRVAGREPVAPKRTYLVTLLRPGLPGELERLRAAEPDLVATAMALRPAGSAARAMDAPEPGSDTGSSEPAFDEAVVALHQDCVDVMIVLATAAGQATQRDGGQYALKVRTVLRQAGFRDASRIEEVLYYLKELSLAVCIDKQTGRHGIYWWQIRLGARPRIEALAKLACNPDRKYRVGQRGPDIFPFQEVRRQAAYAGGTPHVLRSDQVGPVSVQTGGVLGGTAPSSPNGRTAPLAADSSGAQASSSETDQLVDELLGMIERYAAALKAAEANHAEVVATLEQRIAELVEQNATLVAQNDSLIARLGRLHSPDVLRRLEALRRGLDG